MFLVEVVAPMGFISPICPPEPLASLTEDSGTGELPLEALDLK